MEPHGGQGSGPPPPPPPMPPGPGFGPAPAPPPPPGFGSSPSPGYGYGSQPPVGGPAPYPYSYAPPGQRPGDGPARTALTCGIIGVALVFVFFPLAIVSVILGIVALLQAAKARREAEAAGAAMPSNAKSGRVLGILSIVFGSLATTALIVGIAVIAAGGLTDWFDTGQTPQVVSCAPTDGGTRAVVLLVADEGETLEYDYTLEVRDVEGTVTQVERTVTVRGTVRDAVFVPMPNGRRCTVSYWFAY